VNERESAGSAATVSTPSDGGRVQKVHRYEKVHSYSYICIQKIIREVNIAQFLALRVLRRLRTPLIK
jgi:hypothetical protein